MVKQYRGINEDIKEAIRLARLQISQRIHEAREHHNPMLIYSSIDEQIVILDRLAKSIKTD